MPLRNKEFICFTKNKCHVRSAAITQFYLTKYEVTTSYSGLCLLQHSPMPNLSHFSHARVHATHTHIHACMSTRAHANTLCQQTDPSVNTVTDCRPNWWGFYYQKQYWKLLAATALTTRRPT
jgi:competence CoiA-like predicted nuclease